MRILFSAPVGTGHLLPMVPLAKAAARAGHEVLFGVTGANLDILAPLGLRVVDIAPDKDVTTVFGQLNAETQVPGIPVEQLLSRAAAGWAEIADLVLDGMLRTIERHQIDVVVYEPYHVAALTAANLAGVPSVLHGTGVPMRTFRPALELTAHGTGSAEPTAAVTVCPSSFTSPRRDKGWPMRYTPFDLHAPLPGWVASPASVPRVCVTFGSVLPGLSSGDLVSATLAGLRDLEVEVVLSTGGADLPELPANVRAAPWLPMSEVLPTCAAVVHHGGSGTTFGAMAAGVAQVVLPHGADQPVNAAAVAKSGVGVVLDTAQAGAAAIRAAVREVVEGHGYRTAAEELAAENAARPTAAEVVDRMAALRTVPDSGRVPDSA